VERPFKNYAMIAPSQNAEHKSDRYTEQEDLIIRAPNLSNTNCKAQRCSLLKKSQRDYGCLPRAFLAACMESIDQDFLMFSAPLSRFS